jgi:hypothetical protein
MENGKMNFKILVFFLPPLRGMVLLNNRKRKQGLSFTSFGFTLFP